MEWLVLFRAKGFVDWRLSGEVIGVELLKEGEDDAVECTESDCRNGLVD